MGGAFSALRRLLPTPVLLSLPYSHFVELARFALESPADGAPREHFLELKLPVGPHILVVGIYRVLFAGGRRSGSSFPGSDTPQPWWMRWFFFSATAPLRRLSGLPAYVTQEGKCLPDSWSILAHSGYVIDPALRKRWDETLGPAVRRWGYYNIFRMPGVYRELQSCGPTQMVFFDLMERCCRTSSVVMPAMMGIDEAGVAAAEDDVRAAFAEASEVLAQHAYLGNGHGGAAFGGADLAFAALTGWVVQPLPRQPRVEQAQSRGPARSRAASA